MYKVIAYYYRKKSNNKVLNTFSKVLCNPSYMCTCVQYCISCYFREGFIFVNFASQNLAKISTSIYVYMSIYRNENISKIAKLSPREFPYLHVVQIRENTCIYKCIWPCVLRWGLLAFRLQISCVA